MKYFKQNNGFSAKTYISILLIAVVVSLQACFKVDEGDVDFPFQVDTEMYTVVPVVDPYAVYSYEIAGVSGVPLGNADSVVSKAIRIINMDNQPLDFLYQVTLYVTYPGLPDKEIAYRDFIPVNTGTILDLIPSLPEVSNYISQPSFGFKLKFSERYAPSYAYMNLRFEVVFKGFYP